MIQWNTLICDVGTDGLSTGRISLHRVRKLAGIVFACVGVLVALLATMLEVLTRAEVPTDMVLILVSACVLPLTGGQVSDAIFGTRLSRKIQAGEAPSRRASDAAQAGPTE